MRQMFSLVIVTCGLALMPPSVLRAVELEFKPDDPLFAKYEPLKAPAPGALLLKTGDRLAICGDSITEERKYSRLMEIYLTVCVPELKITVRQYGWAGETAEGFLSRMKSDCLRFNPTVATTSYGMNDYRYRPYDEANGQWYRARYDAVVKTFKDSGTRVVLGSSSCVGKVASWVKSASGTVEEHNQHLCKLRNIGIEIAEKEQVRFADVFWTTFLAGFEGRKRYGENYAIAGQDGVHPGWAGQLVMAYTFLHAMGLNGEIGVFTVDLEQGTAAATAGHVVDGFADGELRVTSQRYPFCATGETNQDSSVRSGMTLVPFNRELNRLILVVKRGKAANYEVTWGTAKKLYHADQLANGVNLADDFPVNPFSESFSRVDAAVAAKQEYETKQVKGIFHGAEGQRDLESAVKRTEAERAPLAAAIQAVFTPVKHRIHIRAQ